MSEPTLTVNGARARIELHRPEKRNRIEPPDLVALVDIFEEIDANKDIRSVVLTASGPVFCSGITWARWAVPTTARRSRKPRSASVMRATDSKSFVVPTICALNGSVYGGGTDLALCCDFRIGIEGSRLGMPAAKIGLQYYSGGIRRYVTAMSPGAAKRMFLTAMPVPADELLRLGYYDEVVPEDQLEARVDELATAIEGLAPMAIANMKRAINDVANGDPDWDAIEAGAAATMKSADHREGIRALREKRPPEFTGS